METKIVYCNKCRQEIDSNNNFKLYNEPGLCTTCSSKQLISSSSIQKNSTQLSMNASTPNNCHWTPCTPQSIRSAEKKSNSLRSDSLRDSLEASFLKSKEIEAANKDSTNTHFDSSYDKRSGEPSQCLMVFDDGDAVETSKPPSLLKCSSLDQELALPSHDSKQEDLQQYLDYGMAQKYLKEKKHNDETVELYRRPSLTAVRKSSSEIRRRIKDEELKENICAGFYEAYAANSMKSLKGEDSIASYEDKLLKSNSIPVEMMPQPTSSININTIGDLTFSQFKSLVRSEVSQKMEEINSIKRCEKCERCCCHCRDLRQVSVSTESSPRLADAYSDQLEEKHIELEPSELHETLLKSTNFIQEQYESPIYEQKFMHHKTANGFENIMKECEQDPPLEEQLQTLYHFIHSKYPKLSIAELKKLVSYYPDEPQDTKVFAGN